jgi:Ca2+-binding EF-hand superfamily protein/voltage-gated potassium channel Kch
LLGIFFITAGAELNPDLVIHNLPILSIGIITFIVIKALVLFLAGPAMGKTWAGAARVAITLSGGGEFSLVLFKLAQQLKVLPASLADLLTASVIISMSLTPLLANLADAAGNYIESNMVGGRDLRGVMDSSAYYGEDGRPLLTPANAEVLFSKIDVDNSGTLEFTELQTALVERGLGYAAVAKVFEAFDKDNDGFISRDEWEKGLHDGLLQEALWVGRTAEAAATSAGQVEVGGKLTNVASDAIVICGFTEFGKEMYEVLEACGRTVNGGVVAFELNPSRVSVGIASNANIIYGDGASAVLLRSAGVSKPRAVIVAYRSEARRLEAISRLRGALPPDTPIYARVCSGQALGRKELMQAGATDVVSERTEAAVRFGALVGAIDAADGTGEFRKRLAQLKKAATKADPTPQVIPGIPADRLQDMAEEFGCSLADMKRLYEIFSSVPEMEGQYVNIQQLRDVLLRTVNGPVDDEELEDWTESADREGGGQLSFVDFARVYFKGIKKLANKEKNTAAVAALDLDGYQEQEQ